MKGLLVQTIRGPFLPVKREARLPLYRLSRNNSSPSHLRRNRKGRWRVHR